MSEEHDGMKERTGGCMCGAVRYKATFSNHFSTCYCKMCQRWSGGAYMGTTAKDFQVTEGEDTLVVFASSDWAERAFCGTCGSNIYYHAASFGSQSVALGSLDDCSGLEVSMQYFIDQKPEGFSLAESTKVMTSEEIAKAFGSAP
jgi:hypothetical protein